MCAVVINKEMKWKWNEANVAAFTTMLMPQANMMASNAMPVPEAKVVASKIMPVPEDDMAASKATLMSEANGGGLQ